MISDMKAFENYLKQFPDYQNGILETLQPHLTSKDLKEGAYFVHYGSVCRHIAFVEQGLLRVFYFSNGREITNCFCREGAITTSYSSFSTQKVRRNCDSGIRRLQAHHEFRKAHFSSYTKRMFSGNRLGE
jgi:hypothetical protein